MRAGPAFTTRIDTRNGVTSIALSGELDVATAPNLVDELTAVERDGPKAIMLDLRDLGFIDSTGLHALVAAHGRSQQNGHRFYIVGASPLTRRLCQITGTEFLLDSNATVELLQRFAKDGTRTGEQLGERHRVP